MIYQGLDFHRNPLPVDQVAATSPIPPTGTPAPAPSRIFDRPVVIWSGTWRFSRADVARVTSRCATACWSWPPRRTRKGYERLAGLGRRGRLLLVLGRPAAHPRATREKLAAMAQTVHGQGGRWIAPAAPGFDARKVGGTKVVERRDGATLRRVARRRQGLVTGRGRADQLERVQRELVRGAEPPATAAATSTCSASLARPPASEAPRDHRRARSQPDPTTAPGTSPEAAPATDPAIDFASDEPAGHDDGPGRLLLLGSLLLAGLGSLGVLVWRASRARIRA